MSCHVVECAREIAQLILRREVDTIIEVATGQGVGPLLDSREAARELARNE